MIIVLCGFMGSGKSWMLNRLRGDGFDAFDLDEMVVKRWGAIEEIVKNRGWTFFRNCEQELLHEILEEKDRNCIIALGGGALNDQILKLAAEDVHFIWLDTPFETCWSRIKNDSTRPLVAQGKDELQKLYQERVAIYKKAGTHLNAVRQEQVNNTADLIGILDEAQRKY